MQALEVHSFARKLLDAHGSKAELEAAQKATECEQRGDKDEAATWRRVQATIKTMRAPRVS